MRIGEGKYCSPECSHIGRRNRVNVTCANCGKEFEIRAYRVEQAKSLYCSKKCKDDAHSNLMNGSGNPAWKGGVSPRPKNTREY